MTDSALPIPEKRCEQVQQAIQQHLLGRTALDVFISASPLDDHDGFVDAAVKSIKTENSWFTDEPARVYFDPELILAMSGWEHRILHGLHAARMMLVVLSPNYFSSSICRWEMQVYLEHELARVEPGKPISPVYALMRPGFEDEVDEALQQWRQTLRRNDKLEIRPWRPEGVRALQSQEVRRRLAVTRAREAPPDVPSNLPGHNAHFVGRVEELRRVRETLALDSVDAAIAVQGIAGVGKTALAFAYAHTFASDYPGGMFYVSGLTVQDLRFAIVNVLSYRSIDLTDEQRRDLDLGFDVARSALERGPRTLLIIDQIDDADLLNREMRQRCLPRGRGVHIVFTTRVNLERLQWLECMALDPLPEEDALQLLEEHRPFELDDDRTAAQAIVQRLGGHPLALEVVAEYLAQNPQVTYANYLDRLEREGLEAIEGAGDDEQVGLSAHSEKHVSALLRPTLALLSPTEMQVVRIAALMHPDRISPTWLRQMVGGSIDWPHATRRLIGLRLLSPTDDPRIVRMHVLFRDIVRDQLSPGELQQLRGALNHHARERGTYLWYGWVNKTDRWEIEPLRDYASVLLDAADPDGAELINIVQESLMQLGRYGEARALLLRAIALWEQVGEADRTGLSVSYSNLALVEKALGNLNVAKDLLEQAISIEEVQFETDHPNLAVRCSNLAAIERELGHLGNARELLRHAINIEEKIYAATHPNLAISYSNLALVEQGLGNHAAAGDLLRRALTIWEATFGADHPNVATTCANLASSLRALGHLDQARQLVQRAIGIYESAFEDNHPALAAAYANLANVERAAGNNALARDMLRHAMAIEEHALGPEHPHLAATCSNLALVERRLGNAVEARALLCRAIDIWEKRYDANHPTLGTAYSNLGAVERSLGHISEARKLLRRAVEIEQQVLVADHPNLARSYNNLAYGIRLKRFGPDHALTHEVCQWLLARDPSFEPMS